MPETQEVNDAIEFGAEWEEYRQRVPAWIPCLGPR
jgi:protein-S-isoprenylcysteine O-methyltransferase Ste14